MAQLSPSEITSVDDFYFSLLFDESPDQIYPISDSKYAEELQFQESLLSSIVSRETNRKPRNPTLPSSSSSSSSSTSIHFLFASSSQPATIKIQPLLENYDQEEEEFGGSSQFFCEICAERKETDEIFNDDRCRHTYCSDCIRKHVAIRLQESLNVVSCPGLDCKGVHVLELEACQSFLPKEVIERWNDALCEALLLSSERFYCPFRDCSAVLFSEKDGEDSEEVIMESECPICHRLFCAQCLVPWHPGVGCEEFQRLNKDERGREDLMVRELAKEKNWKRCPRCKFYVEKTEGCLHITCRCCYEFCYACGDEWTSTHGGCQRD